MRSRSSSCGVDGGDLVARYIPTSRYRSSDPTTRDVHQPARFFPDRGQRPSRGAVRPALYLLSAKQRGEASHGARRHRKPGHRHVGAACGAGLRQHRGGGRLMRRKPRPAGLRQGAHGGGLPDVHRLREDGARVGSGRGHGDDRRLHARPIHHRRHGDGLRRHHGEADYNRRTQSAGDHRRPAAYGPRSDRDPQPPLFTGRPADEGAAGREPHRARYVRRPSLVPRRAPRRTVFPPLARQGAILRYPLRPQGVPPFRLAELVAELGAGGSIRLCGAGILRPQQRLPRREVSWLPSPERLRALLGHHRERILHGPLRSPRTSRRVYPRRVRLGRGDRHLRQDGGPDHVCERSPRQLFVHHLFAVRGLPRRPQRHGRSPRNVGSAPAAVGRPRLHNHPPHRQFRRDAPDRNSRCRGRTRWGRRTTEGPDLPGGPQ